MNQIDSCPTCGSKRSGDAVAWCKECDKYICTGCIGGLTPVRDPYTDGYYYCEVHPDSKRWYRDDFMRIK